MRSLLLLCAVMVSGCDWFSPPCMKVAKVICNVGSEGDACAFALNVERGDENSQAVCKQVLPAAQVLALEPQSQEAKNGWAESRTALEAIGLQPDPTKGSIERKLKATGGLGGRLVDEYEKNQAQDEQHTKDSIQHVFDEAK